MSGIFDGKLGTKRFCSSRDWGNYCEYIERPGDYQVDNYRWVSAAKLEKSNWHLDFLPTGIHPINLPTLGAHVSGRMNALNSSLWEMKGQLRWHCQSWGTRRHAIRARWLHLLNRNPVSSTLYLGPWVWPCQPGTLTWWRVRRGWD